MSDTNPSDDINPPPFRSKKRGLHFNAKPYLISIQGTPYLQGGDVFAWFARDNPHLSVKILEKSFEADLAWVWLEVTDADGNVAHGFGAEKPKNAADVDHMSKSITQAARKAMEFLGYSIEGADDYTPGGATASGSQARSTPPASNGSTANTGVINEKQVGLLIAKVKEYGMSVETDGFKALLKRETGVSEAAHIPYVKFNPFLEKLKEMDAKRKAAAAAKDDPIEE